MIEDNERVVHTIDRVGDFFEVWNTEEQATVFVSESFGECLDFVMGKWEDDAED